MVEKELKTEIYKKLSQGDSKTIIYNQYKDKSNDEIVRKILAARPSYEQRRKFKKMHLFLSIIWGFFILFELAGIIDLIVAFNLVNLISLSLSIFITVNIWKFNGQFLLAGIIWFAVTIMRSFIELNNLYLYDPDYDLLFIFVIVYCLILAIGIFLMFKIQKNVFGHIKWFLPGTNPQGQIQFEE